MISRRPLAIAIAAATLHLGACGEEPLPGSSDDFKSEPVATVAADGEAVTPRAQSAQPVRRSGICDGSAGVALSGGYLVVGNDENNVLAIYQSDTGTAPVGMVQLSTTLAVGRPNREADIEGAAAIGDTAYWITSHPSAKSGKPLVERHRFFATVEQRTGAIPTVRPAGRVHGGLVKALTGDTALARYGIVAASRRPPEAEGGLNIEGLAATPDGRLLIGFRNPVPEGRALVVPIENPGDVIFRERQPRLGRAMTVALGGRGIRSIEYVPALREYVLVAGSPNGGRDFALYRWSGESADAPRLLEGTTLRGLSPEAIVVESAHPDRLLLLSDDGGRRIGGRDCKEAPESRKFFRSVVLPLPAR